MYKVAVLFGGEKSLLATDKILLFPHIYVVNLHSSKYIILFRQNNINKTTEITSATGLIIEDAYPASYLRKWSSCLSSTYRSSTAVADTKPSDPQLM